MRSSRGYSKHESLFNLTRSTYPETKKLKASDQCVRAIIPFNLAARKTVAADDHEIIGFWKEIYAIEAAAGALIITVG